MYTEKNIHQVLLPCGVGLYSLEKNVLNGIPR